MKTIEKAKKAWVKPDHKLSEEEFEDILANWDYDPEYSDEYDEFNENGSRLLFDKFGNPTYGTFESIYETRHGLTEEVTLEELFAPYDEEG